MSASFQPGAEVDVLVVVEVGIAPLGIVVVVESVLYDEHHVFGREEVNVVEVARSSYNTAYPIDAAVSIEELFVDCLCEVVARLAEGYCCLLLFLAHNP